MSSLETHQPAVPGAPGVPSGRRVLVVDTDPGVRWGLEKGLRHSGYEVSCVGNVSDVLRVARDEEPDVVVMELQPEAGLTSEVLSMLVETAHSPRVLCVSVDADPRVVIECMRLGAADFLPKPFNLAEVRAALARILSADSERPMLRQAGARRASGDGSFLIGISPSMQELRATIEQVAKTDLNCLLRGESGTGKDMVAREIHRLSARRDKPFIKVNCTARPEQLLESELFGYEKGAFTGAVTSKPGRFELAHNGIIFLDEIGDMYPNLQAKLLQVIEHKEFTKLGGRRHNTVDVQIIAATNADLEQKTKEASFRHDLYFRLNEICLWVPPLSSRREDIPLLIRHFIQKHARFSENKRIEISGEELAALVEREWPGNVRELESAIKRWLALGQSVLGAARSSAREAAHATEFPDAEPASLSTLDGGGRSNGPLKPGAEPSASVRTSESDQILAVLERHQWNRRKAAEELGMSYQTLRRRIEKYNLDERM